jgi:two-component system sensor histidine kinase/response regulator
MEQTALALAAQAPHWSLVWHLVYSVPLLATTAGAAALAGYVWKRRAVPVAVPLFGLLVGVACWCMPCAFEPFSTDMHARLLWMKLELPAMACLPVCYLLVALRYTGRQISRAMRRGLFVVPCAIQVVAWTSSHWYWRRIWIETAGPIPLTGSDWGPVFWCNVVYSWAAASLAIFLVIHLLVRTSGQRRREAAIFLGTTAIPVLVSVPDVLGWLPDGCPDLTPFAFGLTAAGMTWLLFRYRFQAIVPIAWKNVFESTPEGMVVLDFEDRVVAMNHAAERLLDRTAIRMLGRPMREAFEHFPALIQKSQLTQPDEDIEVTTEGGVRICEVRLSQLCDQRQHPIAHLVTIRDVTAIRATTEELETAKQIAEASTRAKSQFLANMSHEIRTPMNGVIGMTDLALATELTAEQRDYLLTAKTSADQLLTLLNDILDFSKIEAGKLDISPVHFLLRDCVADSLQPLMARAESKGLDLVCRVAPEVPEELVGDAGRLRQILINLAGNAIKFTAHGEVRVEVTLESSASGGAVLHFRVADTGIGIPGDKHKAVFEAFEQAEPSTTRTYGGTGLGLAISDRLVHLLDGRIWLESPRADLAADAPGPGCAFHFTVAMALGQTPQSPPMSLDGVPVLMVGDNHTNRGILEEMLCARGMKPQVVETGEEALAVLDQARAAGCPFPLAILDFKMPGTDGFTLATNIRAQTELRETSLVMLTSAVQRADAARCKDIAIVYLMKPVKQSALLDTVAQSLGRPATPGLPRLTGGSLNESHPQLRILLAEDNAINQRVAVRLLEKRGHLVTVANDGEEAVAAMKNGQFDVVLMDVQMPNMSGLEATAAIRTLERGTSKRVPIVAMTAHVMKGDQESCLSAGMDAYVSKPIRPGELMEMIARVMSPTSESADVPREFAS